MSANLLEKVTPSSARLSWRRQKVQRGIFTRENRGWELWLTLAGIKTNVAIVSQSARPEGGWFWHTMSRPAGMTFANTATEPVASADEAKTQATTHVRAALRAALGLLQ